MSHCDAGRHAALAGTMIAAALQLAACGGTQSQTTAESPVPPAKDAPEEVDAEPLTFSIPEGNIDNHFFREGEVAAHLALTSGEEPRVLFAFPAGNSGAALWLAPPEQTEADVELTLSSPLEPIAREDGMRGAKSVVEISADELAVQRAVLGTVRAIRIFVERPDGSQLTVSDLPGEMEPELAEGPPLVWSRTSLDGERRYELRLEPMDGTEVEVEDGQVTLRAGDGADGLTFKVAAATDEPPLSPIPLAELLNDRADDDERARNALAFLSYDEKLLAGSWRFLTYFGRDTLLSVRLLMPALSPRTIEAGLGAVIERLSPEGQVAHEEDIAEQAALRNLEIEEPPEDLTRPHYDYKMIDDDVMLAPVLAAYLLETPEGGERAAEFLARKTPAGDTYADALRRNLDLVIQRARPFAESGDPDDLIAIHGEENVGQWRDSQEGLAGGTYPYDVNAVFMPAALRAAAGLLATPHMDGDDETIAEAKELAEAWDGAGALFEVELPRKQAARRVRRLANERSVPADPAVDALPDALSFPALVLDEGHEPIPVMHSDEGYELLFGEPSAEEVRRFAARITMPFPAGLHTPAGVLVSNPAYASSATLRSEFSAGHYHGTTVWSWQQAMFAAGLRRQLERGDLPEDVRNEVARAEEALWEVIDATREMRTSELWTWGYDEDEGWQIVPFGQGGGHQAESNAAQLWSTVYLAVKPPADD